jgi:hypothetical protein
MSPHREYGTPARLLFLAGQECGIKRSYMARARYAHGELRANLVRRAREANQALVRFLIAAQEIAK